MKNFFGRSLFLSFIFTGIAALYFYSLVDVPLSESWLFFYAIQYANVPLGAWIHHHLHCARFRDCRLDGRHRPFKRKGT